jgi:flagellar hook-associated protein 3 FlgL
MRVTQNTILRTSLTDNARVRQEFARIQEQASSGLRINRPSDDPSAAALADGLRSQIEGNERLTRSLGTARGRLEVIDDQLAIASEIFVRARELATQAASDTTDATRQRLIASEIAQLHEQLLASSNLEHEGAYLFGGYETTTPAFQSSGTLREGQPPPTVSYNGDGSEIGIEIEDGVRVETTVDGRRVFLGDSDGDGNPDGNRDNLFDVLSSLWQAMQSNDHDAVRASLDRVARGQEQLDIERARVGGRLVRVESADSVLSRRSVDLASRLSDAQDADSVEVYSALANQQTLLQASLQVTARAIQPSLLDFLG